MEKEDGSHRIQLGSLDSECYYCQLGMDSGRLSLRTGIVKPENWEDTLCPTHLDMITPTHDVGDMVKCLDCGVEYKYLPWNRVMGSQDKRCYCRPCLIAGYKKYPMLLDDRPDAIDIEAELDIISKESEEQDLRDFPRQNKQSTPRPSAHLLRSACRRAERRMDKETIKRFKQREGSAVDVTGLG